MGESPDSAPVWLLVLGWVLIIEGLMPLVAPSRWRHWVEQMRGLHDGQLRFFGLILVVLGLGLVWWAL